MAGLMLKFERDDDGDVRLSASLQVGNFAGAGRCWCPPSAFSSFADDIEPFPLPLHETVRGEWEGCLKLELTPVTPTGVIEVRATVIDFYETRNLCEAVFQCHYAELSAFRDSLLRAAPLGEGEAALLAAF